MNQNQFHEYQQKLREEMQRQQAERVAAARRAAERQQMIDEMPRRKYAIIVAVDLHGGFSKNGEIPWHYPQDFKWFKGRTSGQVCVMGRKTYEDINRRLGEKAATSVLPDRKCFVVSSTLDTVGNATVVKNISEVEKHLADEDADKTIFVIGGDRLFKEGIAIASQVYLTVVNKEYECDLFFPTRYLEEHFTVDKVYKHEDSPDLRFTIWKRNDG